MLCQHQWQDITRIMIRMLMLLCPRSALQITTARRDGDPERACADRDEREEEARERGVSRRQRGAGARTDHRRAPLAAAEAVGAHHAHQGGRRLRLRRGAHRGAAPEAAAPVHQVTGASAFIYRLLLQSVLSLSVLIDPF